MCWRTRRFWRRRPAKRGSRPACVPAFPPRGGAHHILNRSDRDLVILEIGDRPEGDEGTCPEDDIQTIMGLDGWSPIG